jgi:Superinfection immunity protein
MHPTSEPSTFAELVFYLAFGIVLLIIGAIYAAPTLLAFRRDHPNRWIILVINVAFGGTIIGWGIALVWAMRAAHRVGSTSSGGESGLNLFINDVKNDSGRRSSAAAPNIPCARAGTPSRSSCPGCNFPG